jgi:SAM-dependent methyltransferase
LVAIFAFTVLVSAFLLFLIQPLFARMALPLLGGSPNVWIICMVFFQAALLAGYAYAHLSVRWLGLRKQAALHALVILAPLVVLPIAIGQSAEPPGAGSPVLWLLTLLATTVGLPFLAIAASAPLLQRWFSLGSHAYAADPYFLYAASNVGSVAALLVYPTLFEPLLRLGQQSSVWTSGYVAFVLVTSGCAWLTLRGGVLNGTGAALEEMLPGVVSPSSLERNARWRLRLWWIALSFVPSSLTLGVTTVITTDIAAVPMLWVIPLIIYLSSYILVFARRRVYSPALVERAFPIAVLAAMALVLTGANQPVMLIVLIHLLTLFATAMLCHGHLADARPGTGRLTEFYLFIGLGGVLGGIFNALIAPEVFTRITEYPLVLVAACLLAAVAAPLGEAIGGKSGAGYRRPEIRPSDVVYPLALGLLTVGLIEVANQLTGAGRAFRIVLIGGVPMLAAFLLSKRRLRFALSVAAIFIAGGFNDFDQGRALQTLRTFFGVHRVTRLDSPARGGEQRFALNMLYHGTTMHGSQLVDPESGTPVASTVPLVYYHRDGPIGDVLFALARDGPLSGVGVVGLGAGAVAAYGKRGERYHFFEIDPTVSRIAQDARYFRYISDARARGVTVNIILGDARLKLKKFPDASLDLLVLDAFSSDAVPLHLLSREAVRIYLDKLRPGGILAFHLSNRHLDLRDAVGRITADLGLAALWRLDVNRSPERLAQVMRRSSEWLIAARSGEDLQRVVRARPAAGWQAVEVDPALPVWTDDYSNILSVFKW